MKTKPIKKRPSLITQNNGPELVFTNFWDAEIGAQNFAFSVNAGCLRLLVPNCHLSAVPDMLGCDYVIASILSKIRPGSISIELLFEDHSQNPFSIHMCPEACLSLFPSAENSKVARKMTIWTEGLKKAGELPIYSRTAPRLPWLKPLDWNPA
jgi:hypothetical protein